MQITKLADGNMTIEMSADELRWFRQSLNECCNGFKIENFKAKIGVEREAALALLDQSRPISRAPIGTQV